MTKIECCGGKNCPAKKEIARYVSKYLNLRLVNKSSYSKEIEGKVVVVPGNTIEFKKGIYETADPDEIKFLDNNPNCGKAFVRITGKDLTKAREEMVKSPDEKAAEAKVEKEKEAKEKIKEGIAEGSSIPKRKGKSKKSTKKEKPAF